MFRFSNMLILKTTRDCNLRCEYCYIKNKDNYKGEMIDFKTYKTTIDRIVRERKLQKTNEREIVIVFHGGESTLAKKEYMIKMLEYARSTFIKEGIRYKFGIQSNLTLIDDEYANILSKYDVFLGASFDGVGDANETRTKTFKENAFYKKFDLLVEHNIKPGFLMVVHSGNIDKVVESATFLEEKYNINSIKINYAEDVVGFGGEVSGKDFFEKAEKPFLEEFFKTGKLRESNLENIITKFLVDYVITKQSHTSKGVCGIKVCGGGMTLIELDPDGNASFCGRYSESYPEVHLENVKDKDVFSLHQIKRYIDFAFEKHKVILDTGCDTCIADGICDHGCMAFHYSKFGKWGIRTDLVCDNFKELYNYLVLNAEKVIIGLLKAHHNNGIAEIGLTEDIYRVNESLRRSLKEEYNVDICISKRKKTLTIKDLEYTKRIREKKDNEIQKISIDNIVNIRENNKNQ